MFFYQILKAFSIIFNPPQKNFRVDTKNMETSPYFIIIITFYRYLTILLLMRQSLTRFAMLHNFCNGIKENPFINRCKKFFFIVTTFDRLILL